MKEHQGERKGQYANPGKHPQRLTTALMHRWFFEVPFGGHGLEHFAIDNPTTTTQLMDEHGRNGTQLQIAGVEIPAPLQNRFFLRMLPPPFVATNPLAMLLEAAYGFDYPDRAVAHRPVDLWCMPQLQFL